MIYKKKMKDVINQKDFAKNKNYLKVTFIFVSKLKSDLIMIDKLSTNL